MREHDGRQKLQISTILNINRYKPSTAANIHRFFYPRKFLSKKKFVKSIMQIFDLLTYHGGERKPLSYNPSKL